MSPASNPTHIAVHLCITRVKRAKKSQFSINLCQRSVLDACSTNRSYVFTQALFSRFEVLKREGEQRTHVCTKRLEYEHYAKICLFAVSVFPRKKSSDQTPLNSPKPKKVRNLKRKIWCASTCVLIFWMLLCVWQVKL